MANEKNSKTKETVEQKKLNPYTKRNIIQARVDNEDFQIITEKAFVYCGGDISKFVRLACLNYRPLRKG